MNYTKIESAHHYIINLTKQLSEKQLMIFIAIIIGFVAAAAAYIFEESVTAIRNMVESVTEERSSFNLLYLIMPLIGIILVTIFTQKILKDNIGHGVTKILHCITHKRSFIKPHHTFASIIGGATTIGFGGSVGPEAPIVMTGAAVGSNIARFFRMNYRNTTILLGCGAAAALAGIFKAPITGVIFVLEVLMLNISMGSLVPILIAAVTSASIIYFMHGFDPVFQVELTSADIEVNHLPYYAILAALCGMAACYLIYTSSKIEAYFHKIDKQYKKWLLGGSLIGILIMLLPPLYGQGYNSITSLIKNDMSSLFNNTPYYAYRDNVWVVLAFVAATMMFKSIAMALTNAAGGAGGAFAPSLFLGAFTGFFTATLLNELLGLSLPVMPFTLVGMAGVMSGAMDSPLTAMFLIAEITGGYRLFLPLMLVSALSFAICYYFMPYSVYTRELALKGDTASLSKDRTMLFINIENMVETDFTAVKIDDRLRQLAEAVSKSNRNIFPVLNNKNEIEGYVTLDDIRGDMFLTQYYDKRRVFEYMTVLPAIVKLSDPIPSILEKFDKSGAWSLPVVSEDNKYMGFISKSKLFSEYRKELSRD
ncbi:MAG: chloride channel protein [Rikenellaceae bacterium]